MVPEDLPFLSTISFDQDLRLAALWVLGQDAINTSSPSIQGFSGLFGVRNLDSRLVTLGLHLALAVVTANDRLGLLAAVCTQSEPHVEAG